MVCPSFSQFSTWSSEDSISDAMPTNYSSGSASDNVIDIGSIVDGSMDCIISVPKISTDKKLIFKKKNEVISQDVVKGKAKQKKTLGFSIVLIRCLQMVSIQPKR